VRDFLLPVRPSLDADHEREDPLTFPRRRQPERRSVDRVRDQRPGTIRVLAGFQSAPPGALRSSVPVDDSAGSRSVPETTDNSKSFEGMIAPDHSLSSPSHGMA
jgi:hypothetical protein